MGCKTIQRGISISFLISFTAQNCVKENIDSLATKL